MEKRVEVIIERYSDFYTEDENKENLRAYEMHSLEIGNSKKIKYWGRQIRIEGPKQYIFERNYIEEVDGHYLVKEGSSFKESKNIGVRHTFEEADYKALQNIMGKPKSKLLKIMNRAYEGKLSKEELEELIINKHPVFEFVEHRDIE